MLRAGWVRVGLMRLHGWTTYTVNVFMTPEGRFEALISRPDDGDAWRGTGRIPIEAIHDAFEAIVRPD